MPKYPLAGVAHYLIFLGFSALLLRTLVLWGRGFDPAWNLLVLGPEPVLGLPLGELYGWLKDVFGLLVIAGSLTFVYLRVVRREKRMTLSGEGLVILGIITTMMLADLSYDGATMLLNARFAAECAASSASFCSAARELIAPLGPPRTEIGLGWLLPRARRARCLALLLSRHRQSSALVRGSRAPGSGLHTTLVVGVLPEHPAVHEALSHHHRRPERFLRRSHAARAPATACAEHRRSDEPGRESDRRGGPRRCAHRLRAARAFLLEGLPRFLHVHRVRSLLGQLPRHRAHAGQSCSHRSSSRSISATGSTVARRVRSAVPAAVRSHRAHAGRAT